MSHIIGSNIKILVNTKNLKKNSGSSEKISYVSNCLDRKFNKKMKIKRTPTWSDD